ncbi:PREDICTED: CISIN_1g0418261mg [Prunus dulcis]|uniref:PREDICTED: CISIN_1g0418261mg n=1 Tax=Prunus dulcis TaxID=3755 RepID=A0A5E4GLF7_PRUDU|nr:PREDICTED: CISIN_1g0418261mg [Prunus dulcis]
MGPVLKDPFCLSERLDDQVSAQAPDHWSDPWSVVLRLVGMQVIWSVVAILGLLMSSAHRDSMSDLTAAPQLLSQGADFGCEVVQFFTFIVSRALLIPQDRMMAAIVERPRAAILAGVAGARTVEMSWSSLYKKAGQASNRLVWKVVNAFRVSRFSECVLIWSRSDMSDSQDISSTRPVFMDDEKDIDMVDEMYEAAKQMGKDMPVGLGGNFEYSRARGRAESEEEWISQLGAAPHQMNPNVYRTMVSVQAQWLRVHRSEPTVNQMLHCFMFKRSPYQVGFCYLQSAVEKIIESNPSSQKTWKPHWFYASGAWEFVEGVELKRPRIQRRFRMPGRVVVQDASMELDRADLSAAEQEQVDVVLALPSSERATNRLLVNEGLINFVAMRPSRSDLVMLAKLLKTAKGSSGRSAGGTQQARVGASPHMSVAWSQATAKTVSPAREAQKRRADEQLPLDTVKRRVEHYKKTCLCDEIICNAQNFITFTKDK